MHRKTLFVVNLSRWENLYNYHYYFVWMTAQNCHH